MRHATRVWCGDVTVVFAAWLSDVEDKYELFDDYLIFFATLFSLNLSDAKVTL